MVEQKASEEKHREKQEERAKQNRISQMWKDMASLTDKAPKFDGTEDVLFWLNSMRRYYKRNKIDDVHMRREILIGSLKGVAQEWFNALDDNECD
jgi:tRNA C32,U32 (ribose-2'-O)-methylase TrmJ